MFIERKIWLPLLTTISASLPVYADTFLVKHIEVVGLERIDVGTVYNEMPIAVGDEFSTDESEEVISALYKTGFFEDVYLGREDNTLIVYVLERPTIGKITITGNKDIKTEDLEKGLRSVGIGEGLAYDQSILIRVEQELEQQYYSRGKYGAHISSKVTQLDRNRVELDIDISEGVAAKIKQISIVGNHAFSEDELLKEFTLTTPNWLSWITKDDQYAREKLQGDLETLYSYYLDRGYLEFNINSTQVSITPNKKDIYITINVTEGDVYTVSDVKLEGDLIVSREELEKYLVVKPGETFSKRKVTFVSDIITQRIGNEGYAFAKVNVVPEINEETNEVGLTFIVNPGKRIYVRRINFQGNHTTNQEVLRREILQMESSWVDSGKIKASRNNLMMLGFFKDVQIETKPVPGVDDLVDVEVNVEEQPAGQITGGIGYSQVDGFVVTAGVTQKNFLGTGNMVNFAFNQSRAFTSYRLSYNNPYYTSDGVGRGFDTYYQETDLKNVNVTNYIRDAYGGTLSYGIPISARSRLNVAVNAEDTDIITGDNLDYVSDQVQYFVDKYGHNYVNYKLRSSFTYNTLDRSVFPTKGIAQTLTGEIAVPGSSLTFYKASSTTRYYKPIYKDFILAFVGDFAYGNGYSKIKELPFYENFFAGGIGSVRGFLTNTLGPRDSLGDPLGGNFMVTGSAEAIFPLPFIETNTIRTSWFVDAGNVFNAGEGYEGGTHAGGIRVSTGLAVQWLSPIGPFVVSLGQPIVKEDGDEEEFFQFTIGTIF